MATVTPKPADLRRLVDLVARLRAPDGSPWDREQTLPDTRAYLLEEAHETAGAIDSADWSEIASELGDLLFQAAFIARLGEEAGAFQVADAIEGVHEKMVARHPHVFGDEELADAEAVRQAWERRKLDKESKKSLLQGVSPSLPALLAAYRLTQKASGVGFDWPDTDAVFAKVDEELGELRQAISDGMAKEAVREEIGDLLFTIANLARKLDVDPEAALAATNLKFRKRFEHIETTLAERGQKLGEASLDEMDALWDEAKSG